MKKEDTKGKRRKPKFPRVPLPRKAGGPMLPKPKRKPKYKINYKDGDQDDV